jgi:hypothetical protein
MKSKFLKILKSMVCVVLICFAVETSHGQDVDVEIILSPTLETSRIVYVSSFDFLQIGSTEYLFEVRLNNRTAAAIPGRLRLEIEKDHEIIADAISNLFNLPTGLLMFNNMQLNAGFPIDGGEIIFENQNINPPTDEFENDVYQGGKLPGGIYTFKVIFSYNDGQEEAPSPPAIIEIISSAYVSPIAPGSEDGFANPDIIFTEFPLFHFNSNYADPFAMAEAPYRVQVFKKLDQHKSPDEVLTNTPHLDINLNQKSFQYPQSGGGPFLNEYQPLSPGTYVWRVELSIQTSNGIETVTSPLYSFKYVDPTDASEDLIGRANAEEVLRLLRYLIGSRADDLANQLSDYILSDMRRNGEKMSTADFFNQISNLEDVKFKVENVELQHQN